MFRDQFEFEAGELEGLRDYCVFLISLYVKAWFKCTSAIHSPLHDLEFIKQSIDFGTINKQTSQIILKKISNHLYYLSEEHIALAFFDSAVSIEEKRKMVIALQKEEPLTRRLKIDDLELESTFKTKNLSDFVSINTMKFFDRFDITTDFLTTDPSKWEGKEDFKQGVKTCEAIQVVNDSAERGVKLFSDYNQILSMDEEEKQFIVKVVQYYLQAFPSYNRSDLI